MPRRTPRRKLVLGDPTDDYQRSHLGLRQHQRHLPMLA
jgi:hypothetical protein